tara:strand:- start:49495 stop:50016 length:522 start_codon:yes stop_codon:yes gene_type:complete
MASFSSAVSALNAITPIIGSATQLLNAGVGLAQGLGGGDSDDLRSKQQREIDQLTAQQAANAQIDQKDAALARQQIELAAQDDARRRQNALKRAAAKQRAQFGASGIGSNPGGSGEAVLLGLFEQSEEEKNQADALDKLRLNALEQDLENTRTLNLLQTQQLQANQALERSLL